MIFIFIIYVATYYILNICGIYMILILLSIAERCDMRDARGEIDMAPYRPRYTRYGVNKILYSRARMPSY